MEQFDTDEKLIENSEKKQNSLTITCGQLALIALCCIVSFCALYYVFKKAAIPTTDSKLPKIDMSK